MKALKYLVIENFNGVPKKEDFKIVEYELPPLEVGEVLVKSEWVSVEPYHRAYNSKTSVPYDQFGFQVGLVEDSRDPQIPIGSRVMTHKGWCTYSICRRNKKDVFGIKELQVLSDLKGLSPSLAIGALGFSGYTAYFGLLDICKPKTGETIVVTGAAGAIGSLVGQIAKVTGCRVIGIAGTDEKVNWLENELKFDVAINYRTANIMDALKQAAPNGVDCFFDNVGGEINSIIIKHMNNFGRVCVCGSISMYNEDHNNLPKVTVCQLDIVMKQLKIEGFLTMRFSNRFTESFDQIMKWIQNGDIKVKEHVTKGFYNIFDAFVGMLAGENIGKAVVKI